MQMIGCRSLVAATQCHAIAAADLHTGGRLVKAQRLASDCILDKYAQFQAFHLSKIVPSGSASTMTAPVTPRKSKLRRATGTLLT